MGATKTPLVDADNHYYEPVDAYTRHLRASQRERGLHIETADDGTRQVRFGDRPFTFLREPFHCDRVAAPGALREMLRSLKSGRVSESDSTIPMHPAFQDRDARIALMDEQGLDAVVMFPTTAAEHLDGLPPEDVAQIMGGNTARLLGR